ncbi:MAG: hypothetical protein LBK42_06660 [Propionibacteriaceae bacterium]|nr:hypothetical protein [Propionibacteriaceae bacterium]
MAVVSIDIEAMRAFINDLGAARDNGMGAATDMQSYASQAGVYVSGLGAWTGGSAIAQLDDLITWCKRALSIAEELAASTPGFTAGTPVLFDDGLVSSLSAQAAQLLGIQINQRLINGEMNPQDWTDLARYANDPYFTTGLTPMGLAGALADYDQRRQGFSPTDPGLAAFDVAYDKLLCDLAGSISSRARSMNPIDLDRFDREWAGAYTSLTDSTASRAGSALSLIIGRGDWPTQFLNAVTDAIMARESTQGAGFWAVSDFAVVDPEADPLTGEHQQVMDPLAGVFRSAAQHNSEWFLQRFSGGDSATVTYDVGDLLDQEGVIGSRVHDLFFSRGLDDTSAYWYYQATLAAVAAGLDDAQPLLADLGRIGGLAQRQLRLQGEDAPHLFLLLGSLLTAFIPVVGPWISLGLMATDSALYFYQGDWLAGVISAVCVIVPLGIGKALRYATQTFSAAELKALQTGKIVTTGEHGFQIVNGELKILEQVDGQWVEALNPVTTGMKPTNLMTELAASGEKYTADAVVMVTKTPEGKLVWLETGNSNSGLDHILKRHATQFAEAGVPAGEVPDYLKAALSEGKIVGYQGNQIPPRPVYEFTWKGETHQVAISVGDNGFIVGANPKPKPVG